MGQTLAVNGQSVAGEFFTLYWNSGPLQPNLPSPLNTNEGWQGPIISPYYAPALWPPNTSIDRRVLRGTAQGSPLPFADQPWCQDQGITVRGVQAQLIGNTAHTRMGIVLGQATGAGPDVFFHLAGVGAVSDKVWLPSPGIPFGPEVMDQNGQPTINAHFDVYGMADDLYTILLSIFYTSP